jgi:hypothetical protein
VEEGEADSLGKGRHGERVTLLPCKTSGGRAQQHCIRLLRRIARCGWQAVNAPLKGQLTTNAAMGELVNQLTSVLTN